MPKKVAVTGAGGFIGHHVLKVLAASDVEITLATRSPEKLAMFAGRARIVSLDLAEPGTDPFDVLGRPDILVHLAWGGLPNYRSLSHFEVELPRQYNFLRRLADGGLASLLATGTCFEYGMQEGMLSEEMLCLPTNPYGLAKHTLHQQLTHLRAEVPFKLTWARLFYTYGQGQAPSSLWSQLDAALQRDDHIFDMSGGEQLRDFLPVEVLAAHLVDLAMGPGNHGAVNVCSGRPRSVRSLVEDWIAASRKSIELNLGHYPYPDYEPMAFWGDRTKLDSILTNLRF